MIVARSPLCGNFILRLCLYTSRGDISVWMGSQRSFKVAERSASYLVDSAETESTNPLLIASFDNLIHNPIVSRRRPYDCLCRTWR